MKGVSAEDATAELERIYGIHGKLTSSAVVEEARPKGAVLHGAFEWNDKRAAEEYRRGQARTIIRAVLVVDDADEKKASPVFVHVRAQDQQPSGESREGEYHPTEVVVKRVDLFEQALSELERRVSSALASVEALKRAAQDSDDADRLARVALAVRALETASAAIGALH